MAQRTHPHQWSAPRLGAARGHLSFYHRFKRPAGYRISLLRLDLLENPTSTTKRDLTRPPSYLGSSASSLQTGRPSTLSTNPGDYRGRAACPCQQTRTRDAAGFSLVLRRFCTARLASGEQTKKLQFRALDG